MRKHLKRSVAMLLAVVMVLAMLPTVSVFASDFTANPIGLPEDGATVVIYNAKANGVFGSSITNGVIDASSATATEEGLMIVHDGAGAYVMHKNSDGTYYITCGGKYLTCSSNTALAFTASPTAASKWRIEADGATGGYFIINNSMKQYGTKDLYIEYYYGFKPYSYGANYADSYPMFFYELDEGADADGDGILGELPEAGEKPKDGETVIIYNNYGGAAFGAQSDDETAPSLNAVESTLEGNVITPGNGALIFTVHTDGTYYTFENNGKFLRTSENAEDGSNAECLYFDEVESDYTKWTLEECAGGYIMYNKIATYKKNKVAIEYFSNSFSGWTYNGTVGLFAMNFVKVEDELSLGYVLSPKMTIDADNAYIGVDYDFDVILDELSEVKAIDVTYTVDGGTAKAAKQISKEGYEYTYSVPAADLAGKSSLTLKGTATNEYGMEYTAEVTVQINDEPIIVSVSPLSNAATQEDKRPEIVVNIANCGTNPIVVMTIDDSAVTPTVTADKISYKPASNMVDDRHSVYVSITRADGKKTEMTWSFFVGEPGLSLYFGQMHSHTAEYSDGAGQLEDAYEYAMNAPDVDFMIVTDHSNYFDDKTSATTSSYYDLSSLTKGNSKTKWEEAKDTAAYYDSLSSDFVAGYGYEMTWSGGPGHTNTFNTYGSVSRNNADLNNKTGYSGMHLYNDLMANANRGLDVDGNPVAEGVQTKYIEDAPVVSQLNHPGATFGTFDNFAGYTPVRDSVINLIEVGNGEGAVGGSSYWPSYSQYDTALAKGWHVAPTNNQDNHKGKWGDANTCRDVILTDDFTEAGLYKAMAERRVYSTEDQNLRIYYYLNGELMGSIIDTAEQEVKEVNIKASISDPDGEGLGKIEIIGENGLTLKSFETASATYELNATIDNNNAYYYLKITQADGDIAVTAPVWVGVATPITADLKTNVAMSVFEQEETLTTTVTNAAADDYNISKIEFTLTANGETTVIKTIEEAKVVKAGEELTTEIKYVRTAPEGEQVITVTYYGTYSGKEFKCQASITNNVNDPAKMIHVAVDYGHDNYYISGDYSGSAGNFIQFCADNGVMCTYLNAGEFTYENLSKYNMVVLTVPYLRNNAKANMYTADEIAALAKYAEEGGNIIICSKSDRDNMYDNCADNSNALLEAIGANTRVINGIIVDNELKANEAYRLYFSQIENFNTEHRFTKGAYTSSNAFGTQPHSENQTGFQLYNGGPLQVLDESKVEVLVRGYESTWASHYDGYFDGSSFVPEYDEADPNKVTVKKGEVNIMTYEDLPGGGWVITSGVTFFSNYDIKDDQDYANKYILKNILRDLTLEGADEEVTPISTVKKQSEGEYTIDGYVTSNASAYDQDTAFFDCIYVQDKQGNGINVFPVAGNFAIGMNVRCHGGVTFYCGEVELNLSTDYNGSIRIISDELYEIKPASVTCKTAMSDAAIGNLMKVGGIVTSIHKTEGVIDKIYVRDATGEACVFINGYINKDYKGLDNLQVGMMITAVGIGSRDVDESSATASIFARLRVRNRGEIKIVEETVDVNELFIDVPADAWYCDAVEYAVTNGLLVGTSNNTFEPETTLTRAMVATVLYRMAGEPTVNATNEFSDVPAGTWYTNAVIWAKQNGIVSGYTDGTFRPDNKITRQEMAVMLVGYAKFAGMDVAPKGDLTAFPDAADVATWASNAVTWCVDNGIISGDKQGSVTKLNPENDATRAMFASIIMRFDKLAKGE